MAGAAMASASYAELVTRTLALLTDHKDLKGIIRAASAGDMLAVLDRNDLEGEYREHEQVSRVKLKEHVRRAGRSSTRLPLFYNIFGARHSHHHIPPPHRHEAIADTPVHTIYTAVRPYVALPIAHTRQGERDWAHHPSNRHLFPPPKTTNRSVTIHISLGFMSQEPAMHARRSTAGDNS